MLVLLQLHGGGVGHDTGGDDKPRGEDDGGREGTECSGVRGAHGGGDGGKGSCEVGGVGRDLCTGHEEGSPLDRQRHRLHVLVRVPD